MQEKETKIILANYKAKEKVAEINPLIAAGFLKLYLQLPRFLQKGSFYFLREQNIVFQ